MVGDHVSIFSCTYGKPSSTLIGRCRSAVRSNVALADRLARGEILNGFG
jgi:hypothetical protein